MVRDDNDTPMFTRSRDGHGGIAQELVTRRVQCVAVGAGNDDVRIPLDQLFAAIARKPMTPCTAATLVAPTACTMSSNVVFAPPV